MNQNHIENHDQATIHYCPDCQEPMVTKTTGCCSLEYGWCQNCEMLVNPPLRCCSGEAGDDIRKRLDGASILTIPVDEWMRYRAVARQMRLGLRALHAHEDDTLTVHVFKFPEA